MATLREIITEWTTPKGGTGFSIMYFDAAGGVPSAQRSSLQDLWTDCAFQLADTTEWTIATTGKQIDSATGTLTGFWSETTSHEGVGSGGVQMADATQLLLQWVTTNIVAGRRVRGRTYLPGVGWGTSSAGEPLPAVVVSLTSAAEAFVTRGQGFGVWSRPAPGRAGSFSEPVNGAAWTEYAVQRRRRS